MQLRDQTLVCWRRYGVWGLVKCKGQELVETMEEVASYIRLPGVPSIAQLGHGSKAFEGQKKGIGVMNEN